MARETTFDFWRFYTWRVWAGYLVPGVAVLLGMILIRPPGDWTEMAVAFFGPLFASVGSVFVGKRMMLHERGNEVIKIVLEHRVCPSCGYSLDGVAIESDGCCVCPECGSAWRVGLAILGDRGTYGSSE